MIGGIDEAGRGPVLGPLVVCGVAIDDPGRLSAIGVRDSKLLSPDRRRALDRAIRTMPGVRIAMASLSAEELEQRMARSTLNLVEADTFADVARRLGVDGLQHLVVDAADVDAERFGDHIRARLPGVRVLSQHKADTNHAVVGAASILAKVARDEAVAQLGRILERKVGVALGSGYPGDEQTQRFLEAWWRMHKSWP
ncbi:MAG TPA: ribonuclease HII, partial [Candidatus Thermoplasmatota archaeon]|nr:ribonuclease HII [Candidatus Thermoplasmatota archaeon]